MPVLVPTSLTGPSFWNGRRVLITGHTGFKGSWLSLWLLELGAEVTGLALPPETQSSLFLKLGLSQRLDHRVGDIRDADLLKDLVLEIRPDVVFHLAAQPLVRLSYQEPVATWATNVMGTIYLLEALRLLDQPCSCVFVMTDKVYRNNEWVYGYRENDPLGGHDPYSSSKAAAEIAIGSWRSSYCGPLSHQTPHLRLASARAGNVIGGGDWATDRIVPDAMRSLARGEPIPVRNPKATRPWQHVLEPLAGYLRLAEVLATDSAPSCEAFNFGPTLASNRPVGELVSSILEHWPGEWLDQSDPTSPHEANLLHLQIDKAHHQLGWKPCWDYDTTLARTVGWYRAVHEGAAPLECCLSDLNAYSQRLTTAL